MSDKVTVYKEEEFRERVSNSVRANFGMLIPEEEFDSLVQKEIKAYFEEEEEYVIDRVKTGWRNDDEFIEAHSVTPFRKQIWNEIEKIIKENLKKDLMKSKIADAVDSYWGQHGEKVVNWNDVITNMTKEIAPVLAEKMFERVVAEAVMRSTDAMRSELNNIQGY